MTNVTHIGSHDYAMQVGFFNFAHSIAANPGAEAEQTKAYLERKGVQVDWQSAWQRVENCPVV